MLNVGSSMFDVKLLLITPQKMMEPKKKTLLCAKSIKSKTIMTIPECKVISDILNSEDSISGEDIKGGFAYKLDLSKPYIATAIHAGHKVRQELLPFFSISEEERFYEEDPATDLIINECPNSIWGLDSRTEYDLNRPSQLAIPLRPEMFWGTKVYKNLPSNHMIKRSRSKYENFYTFMGSVITIILDRFGYCVIYDFHSYNIDRQKQKGHTTPPEFNVGTEQLNEKWRPLIDSWISCLGDINGIEEIRAAENEVFFGKGELCRRLSSWNENILVLPTEISKFYMDEKTGVIDDNIVNRLKIEISQAVNKHGKIFCNSCK